MNENVWKWEILKAISKLYGYTVLITSCEYVVFHTLVNMWKPTIFPKY